MISPFFARLVAGSARHARLVVACFVAAACVCGWLAATGLTVSTDINVLFNPKLPWKRQETALKRDFPQFGSLIVAVIDARIPEEAEATARDLAASLSADHAHFWRVTQPDADPYLQREGLLFLQPGQLQDLLDRTVDAGPFLGVLAADPSARGLFSTISLIGQGLARGQKPPAAFDPALEAFDRSLAGALAGHAQPLSWETLLAGSAARLAGPYRFVLAFPRLDYHSVRPGGAATDALRRAASGLEFVRAGDAHVNITGSVPLADEEFASAAHGAVTGLILSFVLVMVWLFLGLRHVRLILPVVLTLMLGLVLTTGAAALTVGRLNLISVAFAILFVGIAVDFSIQFTIRFREMQMEADGIGAALKLTGRRVGPQVLIASSATACGFLAFVPTNFSGVAELGLIAGIGMLIAMLCTVTFLPAMLSLSAPLEAGAEPGFPRAAWLDRALGRVRPSILAAFACAGVGGTVAASTLRFDSNTLHTKPQSSEAVRTLYRLLESPLSNPFVIDVIRPSVTQAAGLGPALRRLPLVDHTVDVTSFIPADQDEKLDALADAASVLEPVLTPLPPGPRPDAAAIRDSARKASAALTPQLGRLPAASPLRSLAGNLDRLATAPDAAVMAANTALIRFLPEQLHRLRDAFTARPVTLEDVPDSVKRDYLLPDGRARIEAVPKVAVSKSGGELAEFVASVRRVAPDAGGPAVTVVETARTISSAFIQAGISAVVAIALILLLALGRLLDAALVLAPLLLSAALTGLFMVLAGMDLNFANIIALPLLLGVGVSFNIYFVMNWRAGEPPCLTSPTTRAVVFSALTTGTAFGSLAVSSHPGTASMGVVLLLSLACTLSATLVFVPALLCTIGLPRRAAANSAMAAI